MANNQKPINLEDLPEVLKSQREQGAFGTSPVVNTGQIIVESSAPNWITKLAFTSFFGVMLLVGGMFAYNASMPQNITIVVDLNNGNAESVAKIVSDSGGKVLSVEQKENSTYAVKVSTRKSKKSLLDLLLNNQNIKKAEIEKP